MCKTKTPIILIRPFLFELKRQEKVACLYPSMGWRGRRPEATEPGGGRGHCGLSLNSIMGL